MVLQTYWRRFSMKAIQKISRSEYDPDCRQNIQQASCIYGNEVERDQSAVPLPTSTCPGSSRKAFWERRQLEYMRREDSVSCSRVASRKYFAVANLPQLHSSYCTLFCSAQFAVCRESATLIQAALRGHFASKHPQFVWVPPWHCRLTGDASA